MKLNQEQMQEIREAVGMSFETGHLCFDNKEDFKRDFEGIQPEAVDDDDFDLSEWSMKLDELEDSNSTEYYRLMNEFVRSLRWK